MKSVDAGIVPMSTASYPYGERSSRYFTKGLAVPVYITPPTSRESRAARSAAYEDTAGICTTISRLPSAVLHLVIARFESSSSSAASDEYSRNHDTAPSSVGNVIRQ